MVYQDVPLFIGEACARSALLGCSGDGQACAKKPLAVHDSMGGQYQLISRGCRTYLLSTRPLCLAARLPELTALGLQRVRADFLYNPYTPDEVAAIWQKLRTGQSLPQIREGNYAGMLL